MSSVMQAGPCVRSNQLDYDEDVMYKVSENVSVGERKEARECFRQRWSSMKFS
jgi:hypothetical protein